MLKFLDNMHVTKKRDLYYALFAIGFTNFLFFLTISQFIGGSAPNGMIRNGHYFLGEHGRYRQISSLVYHYSQVHTYSLIVTMPLAIWGLKRARDLQSETEDYSPVTSRNI